MCVLTCSGVNPQRRILQRFNVPTKLAPFGALAGKLGWRFTFNAGYVGQGMIMGPCVCASMLIGTIVAFAGLAPLALRRGWASNPDNRGVDSAQAWVIWVSMAIMIADSLTSLGVLLARYAASAVARRRSAEQPAWDGAGEVTDEADGLVAAAGAPLPHATRRLCAHRPPHARTITEYAGTWWAPRRCAPHQRD